MPLFTINLDTSGFSLDVFFDDTEEGFISSFHGEFKKEGSSTVYPKLYWQVVNMPVGIERIDTIGFALDVDGSTEPFTSLYVLSEDVLREQVAIAMNTNPSNTHYNLLVLNGISNKHAEPIDGDIIALAIAKIESIQTLNVGITGFFTEDSNDEVRDFISTLLKAGFQKLNYDGFLRPEATMVFRPQSELQESEEEDWV